MAEERRGGRGPDWWRSLSTMVNGDREDSPRQYVVFGLVIVACIVIGIVIDVVAG